MIRRSPYVITLMMLMLSGCGSSPPVHYYGLDTIDIDYTQDSEGSPVLALGPFRMPEYLNRSQMVMSGSGAEMIMDDINRWAEPLDDAIHRVLASNLDSLLGSVIVVAYPSSTLVNVDYRLVGRIGRFHSDQSGRVVLEVQWGVTDTEGKLPVTPRRNRYVAQATVSGDPSSVVEAMSDTLAQFSRDMASALDSLESSADRKSN